MDMYQNPYMAFLGITTEEMSFLQQATTGLNENEQKNFYMIYSGKRKNPQDILLFTLLGFVGVAGDSEMRSAHPQSQANFGIATPGQLPQLG